MLALLNVLRDARTDAIEINVSHRGQYCLLAEVLSQLEVSNDNLKMHSTPPIYRGFCCPSEIISHADFLYHRVALSLRDIEELLALRGITVSYESIRRWSHGFGPQLAHQLRRQQGTLANH